MRPGAPPTRSARAAARGPSSCSCVPSGGSSGCTSCRAASSTGGTASSCARSRRGASFSSGRGSGSGTGSAPTAGPSSFPLMMNRGRLGKAGPRDLALLDSEVDLEDAEDVERRRSGARVHGRGSHGPDAPALGVSRAQRRALVLPEGRHAGLNGRGLRVPRPLRRFQEEERRDPGRLLRHRRRERRLREEVRLPVSAPVRRPEGDRSGVWRRGRSESRSGEPHHLRRRPRRKDSAGASEGHAQVAPPGDPGVPLDERRYTPAAEACMAVDPELLAILVCPKTKGPLELVELKEATRKALVEKYREKFRDEEPVVTQGLYSKQADLVYPIVSDIPVMLIDEALPGSEAAR